MGRTVPTFTMVLQQEIESWGKFRRALRREDQEALDDLFRAARLQLASAAYAARPIPFESITMSIVVMQHRAILELQQNMAMLAGRDGECRAVPLLNRVPPTQANGRGGDDDPANDHRMAV